MPFYPLDAVGPPRSSAGTAPRAGGESGRREPPAVLFPLRGCGDGPVPPEAGTAATERVCPRRTAAPYPRSPRPLPHQKEYRMAQQIRELMTLNPVALPGTASVHEAARAMRDADIGDVIVIENNQVCGIVTDRDIVVRTVAEARDPATTTLADLCSHALLTVTPTDSIKHAVQLMRSKAIRRLPVVDGGRAGGIVSLRGLAVGPEPGSGLGCI